MTAPKRDPRALLATGGLLLIPLAALGLALAGQRPVVAAPPQAAAVSASSSAGAARRLVAGAPAQGEWTLLRVTRLVQKGAAMPPSLAPPAGMRAGGPSLTQSFTRTPTLGEQSAPQLGAGRIETSSLSCF